ncbi:MAG: hypothetical protein A2268_07090 [Candidatus Raymondbacteria bacterium RifOxyA12_full_50_37]|uniref:Uncharacterized protein n=1 Tax=Candidatus Raymondbacteria bacterium RIFOXYD12_FULL_49_13 TaxID=1817890 RepID=A0A1F7FEA7_UNCRA|nr:MAG: hypothetical protein A2268_07090 [Candidatus Raymondbacteria bacterium RifOxyA12_full_50_37]OGJ91149.1 MAG: hypothetical protein A2248_01240 [Candidatus Raymondbacteria bacterium RIFOXYA2_FULL_49_16]OGJ97547.1 MAG: hypothetical protein A2453_02005 [Candidatus Raymondbacteria bacterium RIFOXYC2_FULL_50_21]OGK05020.1 MAG: hypothetical protein A2519_10115 [Candidatus Raymondbacteria bacterium RIFOXYD12_FULL_49_13]OGP44376.1 MAG: hypothetical protein A2324_20740 [Candidatus Raymondbacteria 
MEKEGVSQYGYFDTERNEYVITRPDTPTPWINHLGESERFSGVISNTAGGYTFHLDPANKRITRYRYAAIPEDRPGRYFYLKDCEDNAAWSTTWQPMVNFKNDFSYECRHGFGYTKISYAYKDIASENVYFAPIGKDFELWRITVKNNSQRPRKLKLFQYSEWCIWNMIKDHYNAQSIANEARSCFKPEINTFYHYPYADPAVSMKDSEFFAWVAFFACSCNPDSVSLRRDRFIGRYRDESNPIAVEKGVCDGFYAGGGYHVAATQYNLDLGPNEERAFFFAMGSYDAMGDERADVAPLLTAGGFDAEFAKLKKYWKTYTDKFACATPNRGMDVFLNGWHQYNLIMDLWKTVNYSYTGWGGGSVGYRNRAQKTIALATIDPRLAKSAMDQLIRIQYECGDAPGGYSPMTGAKANAGGFSDVPIYLIYAVTAYVQETGDMGLLTTEYPFFEGSTATLYEHLTRIIDWIWSRRGPHGLPIIGIADWNDAINLNGKGETQMVACQFVLACRQLVDMAKFLKRDNDAVKFSGLAEKMSAIVNEVCWDGEWYLRAFQLDGTPVGSHKNTYGKIFLNAQNWAIIAGIVQGERLEQCLASVRKHLFIKCGLKLCAPAYPGYDEKIGPIGSMVPGLKENGAVFCHAHAWGVIATAMTRKGDLAMEYYNAALPYYQDPDVSTTEPYTFCQTYASDEHPEYGLGRLHWHSGTIPWTYIASTQYILGIKPQFSGLLIDPCIPKEWKGYTVKREYRGTIYSIEVSNPDGVSSGVKSVIVDGKKTGNNMVVHDKAKKAVTVQVVLG